MRFVGLLRTPWGLPTSTATVLNKNMVPVAHALRVIILVRAVMLELLQIAMVVPQGTIGMEHSALIVEEVAAHAHKIPRHASLAMVSIMQHML